MRVKIWDSTGEPGTHDWRDSEREYEKHEWGIRTYDYGGYNDSTVDVYEDQENGILVRDVEAYEAWLRKVRLS